MDDERFFASVADGTTRTFANETEFEAFREAIRRGEPDWLKRLRIYQQTVLLLQQQADLTLIQRFRIKDTLSAIESRLRTLNREMAEHIAEAAKDAFRGY